MSKRLTKLILASFFIITLQSARVDSAKLFSSNEYDGEKESFNELESLKCLPSGFPCTPSTQPMTTTVIPEEEDEFNEFTTSSPSTALPEDGSEESESTSTTRQSTTTINSPRKSRSFPSRCCTKCLYEPGWIDAVCE